MISKYCIDTAPQEVRSAHDPDTVFVIRALDGLSGRHARLAAMSQADTQNRTASGAALVYEFFRHGCVEIKNLSRLGDSHKAVNGVLPDEVVRLVPLSPVDIQQEIGILVFRLSSPPSEIGDDEGK